LQAIAMKKLEMAVTYIFVLGLESVLAFLLGVLVFRESASLGRIVAVSLVTAGIILLNR
jgi:multidrug transporter EmrE-like cation transporter